MIRRALNRAKDHLTHQEFLNVVAEIGLFDSYGCGMKADIQIKKLKKILSYAIDSVAYYSRFLDDGSFVDKERINIDNFNMIPVLTKDLIRRNYSTLINDDQSLKARVNTSGGTTGEPIKLLQCIDFILWSKAYKRFYMIQAAGNDYYRLLTIWGSERDILQSSIGLRKKARNYFRMKKMLNAFRMTREDLRSFATMISNYKPDVIEAYVQSIYEIARYVNKEKLVLFKPKGIIVSAGTLYDFMADEINKAFGVPIYNRYGSREVGDIANSCGRKDSLHISMLTHYIEVTDGKGEPLPDGEVGDIVVTSLTNYAMPLIRYMIGDRGILRRNSICPYCGWQGDILQKVTGRTVDVFRSSDGTLIDGEYFTHLFYFREWVQKFQIIQETENKMTINIVKENGFDKIPEGDKNEISRAIHVVMPDIILNWNEVSDIVYDISGKVRFTISKVTE
jgi:phenylacetate-CoA ligase